jgi:YdcK Beta solenoid repeat
VYGNARVYGDAQVSGDARVYGNARVYGDARVSGDAWEFSPIQIRGSKNFINEASKTVIQIGCQAGTADWWAKNRVELGKKNGYSASQIEEYRMYLKLIADVRALRNKKPEARPTTKSKEKRTKKKVATRK